MALILPAEWRSDNPRQQTNLLTSFIDGSVIYGSDDDRSLALRTRQGGKMIMRDDGLLPLNGVDTVLLENVNELRADPNSLFVSGDVRVNEQIGLTAMHTLFSREHNYWADRIAAEQFAGQDLNDPEIDEQIYQLARQIVGVELQIITYNEFLPAVLGDDAIEEYQGYDANVDPRISNVFATAAYRVGHTMLPSELSLIDPDGSADRNAATCRCIFPTAGCVRRSALIRFCSDWRRSHSKRSIGSWLMAYAIFCSDLPVPAASTWHR